MVECVPDGRRHRHRHGYPKHLAIGLRDGDRDINHHGDANQHADAVRDEDQEAQANTDTDAHQDEEKPPKKPKKVKHPAGSTTVTGPHMYVPNTDDSHYKTASTVTVTQVKGLVNQMVQVSWTRFTPSSELSYENTQTDYPVMIAECRGTNPKSPDDCYDATNGGEPAAFGKYGPGNTSYATTTAHGTGNADILLFTNVQNQFLGCDETTPCSLVVVPSQGGDSLDFAKPVCSNHTLDAGGTDLGQYAFGEAKSAPFTPNGYCSWSKRIVIPLTFARTPSGCPLRAADIHRGRLPDARHRDAAVAGGLLLRQQPGRGAVQRLAERERGAQLLPVGRRRHRLHHPAADRGGQDQVHVRSGRDNRDGRRRTGWTTPPPASRSPASGWTPGCLSRC